MEKENRLPGFSLKHANFIISEKNGKVKKGIEVMIKNGKFYLLLTLLTAATLVLLPLTTLPVVSEPTATPAAAPVSAAASTTTAATKPTTHPDIRTEVFSVLHSDGKTVSKIAVRDFLIYTLAAEMLPSFGEEALKAQVVASYTYFCYERELEREKPTEALHGADFADTPVAYPEGYAPDYWIKKWGQKSYDTAFARLTAAVDAVAGVQMQYEGKPIFAAYHAISSGTTELPEVVWASAFPYLQSVESARDTEAPNFETTLRLTSEQFKEKVAGVDGIKLSGDPAAWIGDDVTRSAAGTVLRIVVGGVALTGRECRTLLGLRSACFSVKYEDGGFTFTVHGHGHGVGMSQYGAAFLAEQGASFEEILHHYYTDVEIG